MADFPIHPAIGYPHSGNLQKSSPKNPIFQGLLFHGIFPQVARIRRVQFLEMELEAKAKRSSRDFD